MLQPIEANCLKDLPGIRHGFFTKAGGVSHGIYATLNCGPGSRDEPARVSENRARIARHLGATSSDVVTLYQVHSPTALAVSGPVPGDDRPKADAVVTATPGLAIGVLTADCGPVLFADAQARVVGAAHAGWRGAVGGILEATIAEMERLGARREHIRAAIGPCINKEAYEVGPEFEMEFLKSCADNTRFFFRNSPNARAHFDLPSFVEEQLKRSGIGELERQTACTFENESYFYSYRRSQQLKQGDYGRQISAIVVT